MFEKVVIRRLVELTRVAVTGGRERERERQMRND
jgi:hypothetical protein